MNKRRKQHKKTTKRFPSHTATIELVIDRIGGKGDGISNNSPSNNNNKLKENQSYFIPGTLPWGTYNHAPYFQNSRRYFWTTFGNHKNLY
jgi:hypothetical protein